MKKVFLVLISLLIMPTLVSASSTINTEFNDEECILTVSGTQAGHDATVSLFNEDDELIGFKTNEINDNNYSINFVLSYEEDQKINITLSNESGTNEYSKNDVNIPACIRNEEEEEGPGSKKYEVSDNLGNSITFTEEDGHTFTLTIFDFVGLTDEELETNEIPKDMYEEYLKEINNATKKNGTLISFYKIEVKDENDHLITDGPFKIKLKITDKMKNYGDFKMIFVDVDNNFETEDPITFKVNGDYLEGTLNHLSTYALVGTKASSEKAPNPNTGDKIYKYMIIFGISIIGIALFFIIKKVKGKRL